MDNHIKALNLFIETQKNIYKQRLKDFGCVGKISWDARQWLYGEKGVAWFREGGKGSLNFSCIGRMKGYSNIKIEKNYMDFMRAIIIAETFTTTTLPSGVALEKRLNVLKRWYYEMINTTGQSCPMYLSAEIIHSAMKRHKENSLSPANVSDYCDIAVLLSKRIKHLNIAITSLECKNLYPHRNSSSYTKQRKISEMDGEYTDDEKLITIRAFMCIIEMIYLSTTSGQKIFLNLLMLLIITGFRFREVQALKIDALIKRPIIDLNKLEHARKYGLPVYSLGIKYLGAKKSGWRIHWVASGTIALVESIFDSVKTLTSDSRKRLDQYRVSDFTDFLPPRINNFTNDMVEVSELAGLVFSGSGGTRGNGGFRRSMLSSLNNHGIGIQPIKIIENSKVEKLFYFSKSQINKFIEMRYRIAKSLEKNLECTFVLKENGKFHHIRYEELLFIVPFGTFLLDKDLILLSNPVPVDDQCVRAWLGSVENRKSFFEKLHMVEDDGGRIEISTHIPRHNINTFLAIAGVTDHLQAMLMGRMDITQNIHYQHLAESQSYKSTSLAAVMLASKYDSLPAESPLPNYVTDSSSFTEDKRLATLARIVKSAHSGVDFLKLTGVLAINKNISLESNIKINLKTYGESQEEISSFINESLSDEFLPELHKAHSRLIADKKDHEAKELIRRHSFISTLKVGACTRNVGRWGCPYAMKCQSGGSCGYFTMTGHPAEMSLIDDLINTKIQDITQLEYIVINDSSYDFILKEEREALLILEGFKQQAYVSLKDKKLVSLLSDDKYNPLASIIRRIQLQTNVGKTPRTLADMFFVEQKRKDRK